MNSCVLFFFFQAEDGIRDLVRSRGLGDVYKRQPLWRLTFVVTASMMDVADGELLARFQQGDAGAFGLSLIHI